MATIYQANAASFATADAAATADMVLDLAVKDAISHLRKPVGTPGYRFTRAALALARAEASASRMLGGKAAS